MRRQLATGEPYAGIVSGRLPLVWAHAQVISDTPDKKDVERGELAGRLMAEQVLKAAERSAIRASDGDALLGAGSG